MAKFDFTEQGYIEVYCGEVLVSRHRQEREAIETVLDHAELGGVEATYTIRKPNVKVKYNPPKQSTVGTISSGDAFFDLEGWN